MIKKITGLTASVAALASIASADVKINDNLSVSGYAVAAGTITDPSSGKETYTLADSGSGNLDSAKFAISGKYNDFSGKVSLFYYPKPETSTGDAGILDAYATYTTGDLSITGGKYLSYLGYEAFDPINMTQLTYATTIFAIPAYHTGAKVDYTGKGYSLGFSATDSLMPGSGFFQGDGKFSDDIGYEAVATFTGIEKLTLFVGGGYENTKGASYDTVVFDTWASYALTDTVTLAAEYDAQEHVGQGALALVQYKFSPKLSAIGRVSIKSVEGGDTGTKLTFAPTYTFTENFSTRAEYTYNDSEEAGGKGSFYGIQALFKF